MLSRSPALTQEGTTNYNRSQFAGIYRLRRLYSVLEYDALFEKWQIAYFSAFPPVVVANAVGARTRRFVPTLLAHDYCFLGETKSGRDGESHPRTGSEFATRSP